MSLNCVLPSDWKVCKRWEAFYSDFPCIFKVNGLRRLSSWGSHNDTTTRVLTMMYDASGDSTDLLLLFFPGLACFHELKVDAWIHQSIYLAPDRLIFCEADAAAL